MDMGSLLGTTVNYKGDPSGHYACFLYFIILTVAQMSWDKSRVSTVYVKLTQLMSVRRSWENDKSKQLDNALDWIGLGFGV